MTKTYNITGMKCQGCVNTVTENSLLLKALRMLKLTSKTKQGHY